MRCGAGARCNDARNGVYCIVRNPSERVTCDFLGRNNSGAGMIALEKPVTIRNATDNDGPAIQVMRSRQERAFVGRVDVPVNVEWLVVEVDGIVRACAGFCIATATGHNRTVIATDIYDDGTRAGKRALSVLLDDARQAIEHGVRIYAIVPLDRPQLVRHLERRGMSLNGYCLG